MWLNQVLERSRQLYPQRTAIVDAERRLSHADLAEAADRLAGGLVERGVVKGDRVMVLSRNRAETIVAYFAIARCGAVAVPTNHNLVPEELAYLVDAAGVTGALCEQASLDRLPADRLAFRLAFDSPEYLALLDCPRRLPLPDVELDDLFAILFTSATTGKPKGVMIDHRSIKAVFTRLLADLAMTPEHVFLNCCPLFHGTLVWNLAYLAAGASVAVLREFSPQGFLRLVERARVTHAFVVPSMLRFTLQARALRTTDLSSLHQVVYGGAPMPVPLLKEILAAFPCGFRNCYGITEAGGAVTCLTPEDHVIDDEVADPARVARLGSVGRVHCGHSLRIVGPDGREQPPGEVGEICVRGDGLMRGYWHNPAGTAAVLRDGWIHTGDIGYLDRDGYLFLGDRRNDLILSGGENVYPAEIESVLQLHPAVLDVAVVGAPDHALGEVPHAFVVRRPGAPAAADDLFAFCADRLARYKQPAGLDFVPEIPRSPIGKPLRKVLREWALTGGGG